MPITDMLPGAGRGWRRWGFGAVSVLVHAGLLAALVISTEPEEELPDEESDEEVTYVDIRRFAPPPPPAPSSAPEQAEPEPTPTQPQPQPEPQPQQPRPQTPPRATDIVEQVDSIPDEPLGDTPPAPPARVEQSVTGPPAQTGARSGSEAGGVAGGVEGGVEGGRVGGVVGGQGDEVPEEGGTFIASVVDRQAELTNRRDLPRTMRRLYPNALQNAGIGGRVVVQFVVGTNGRVDMSTVKVISSTDDAFVEPTKRALGEFRFRAARVGDRDVRMLTQMPIVWEVDR